MEVDRGGSLPNALSRLVVVGHHGVNQAVDQLVRRHGLLGIRGRIATQRFDLCNTLGDFIVANDNRIGCATCVSTLELRLEAAVATGKPIVLVLLNGRPLNITWASQHVPAILDAWYPGTEGGNAIADLLFGDANPGGKLPLSWPRSVGQVPIFYAHNITQIPDAHDTRYWDGSSAPLYPFGYGLSYTTFNYSNLVVTPEQQQSQGNIEVSVDVAKTGSRAGDEVVQLYLKDEVSSVTTYESQLRGFERVSLKPGERKTIHFTLHPEDLSLLDKNMNWTVEPGKFEVRIGSSSTDIRLKKEFTILP